MASGRKNFQFCWSESLKAVYDRGLRCSGLLRQKAADGEGDEGKSEVVSGTVASKKRVEKVF